MSELEYSQSRFREGCEPLLSYSRGRYIEAVSSGAVAAVDSDGRLVAGVGDPALPVVLRSGAKPFQLMAVLRSGAVERFGLSDRELAVAAASHNAEPEHLAAARSILAKAGLEESDLACGTHQPIARSTARELILAGSEPTQIHNNCSGKHAAMLAACLARGWPAEGYLEPGHPLGRENLLCLARFAGLAAEQVGEVTDGCGLPTYVLPLRSAALAFARLADPDRAPEQDAELASRVFNIVTGFPKLGSGSEGRLEAALMEVDPGLLAKVGAEGFYGVGVAPGPARPRALGLAVKFCEGITFNRANDPVVLEALRQLGALGEEQLERLDSFHPTRILNCRGEAVGRVEILFDLSGGR